MDQKEYRVLQVFRLLHIDWNNPKLREEYKPIIEELLNEGWSVNEAARRMRTFLLND